MWDPVGDEKVAGRAFEAKVVSWTKALKQFTGAL